MSAESDAGANREGATAAMINTEHRGFVVAVHDRMPVLLRPDQFDAWLDTPPATKRWRRRG